MANSALVSYTKLSPHHSGKRTHAIDTITIHCMAGNLSVETCGALFARESREASSNYGIGSDGRIALYVDEENRSWCTSSRANDQRAVTIEVANNGGEPDWPVSDQALGSLVDLVTDICKRNDIKALVWSNDKDSRMNHANGCNMTVHRDYAAKACPGNYLYNLQGKIASEVNSRLREEEDTMTQEQFDKMMEDYERRHALPVPDSEPYDWEADGVKWATEKGLMAGDGTGNLMLHSPLTRGQFCVMLKRYHEVHDEI